MTSPGTFRLALATIVVISHFSKLSIGTASVELFFVLSGFWIFRMFDAKYRFATSPASLFIASRVMRLLPVFLIFNLLAIALHTALQDSVAAAQSTTSIIPNTLVIGYASLAGRPMVPAWSLDIEMQFYLLFPLVFIVARVRRRYDLAITLAILLLGGIYMSVFLQDDPRNVLPFSGFFLLGALCARNRWRPDAWLAWTGFGLCAGGLAIVLALPSLRGFALATVNPADFAWNTAFNFTGALLLVPLALLSVYGKSSARDRLLGDLSYVVYCSHWLGVVLADHYLSNAGKFAKAPLLVAILAAIYVVSLVVLVYVDRPISRWRERWIARFMRSRNVPAAPGSTIGSSAADPPPVTARTAL